MKDLNQNILILRCNEVVLLTTNSKINKKFKDKVFVHIEASRPYTAMWEMVHVTDVGNSMVRVLCLGNVLRHRYEKLFSEG